MSRRRSRIGINRLTEMLLNDLIKDTHHPTTRGSGGNNKKTNKKEVSKFKHKLWHNLVGDSTPEEAAEKLSYWISNKSRFFAITKGDSLYKTAQKINQFLGEGDFKIKVVFKRSKVIQFCSLKDSLILPKIVS